MRILIVEDHPPFRRMLATLLTQEGYTVETAQTAAEGCQKLSEQSFSLVIADYNLLDGRREEWVRSLREHSNRTNVILMSGMEEAELEQREVGWIAHRFRKPLNIKAFLLVVKRIVKAQGA